MEFNQSTTMSFRCNRENRKNSSFKRDKKMSGYFHFTFLMKIYTLIGSWQTNVHKCIHNIVYFLYLDVALDLNTDFITAFTICYWDKIKNKLNLYWFKKLQSLLEHEVHFDNNGFTSLVRTRKADFRTKPLLKEEQRTTE